MAAHHEHSVKLRVLPSTVQLACNGTYLALPQGQGLVKVWSLQDITCKPLDLEGHRRPVKGLCFGHRSKPTLLCSAAEDYIIVWNIDKARAHYDTGQQIRGTIIGKTLGSIQYVAFNHDDMLVAVCAHKEVFILDAKEDRVQAILEGHTGPVNCAEFCPHYLSTVVTAGDDRTFKVWDISNATLIYQSTIISSSPFISIAMNITHESFALGTTDGQVRVYDLTDGNGFRCLHHLDVGRMIYKIHEARNSVSISAEQKGPVTISSRPSWQRMDQTQPEDFEEVIDDETEIGCSVLGMLYTWPPDDEHHTPMPSKLSFLQQNDSFVSELLDSAPMLVIGTTSAIVQVNARTLEPTQYISLKEPMISNSLMVDARETISLAGNIVLSPLAFNCNKVCAVVGSLFDYDVHILHLYHPTQNDASLLREQITQSKKSSPTHHSDSLHRIQSLDENQIFSTDNTNDNTDDSNLSVLSSAPLLPNSPLKAELVLKQKPVKANKQTAVRGVPPKPGILTKKGSIVDNQPIVFHDKVKSSGYAKEIPKRPLFQPKINPSHGTNVGVKIPAKSPLKQTRSIIKEYPVDSDPPTDIGVKIDVAERPTAINNVTFSDDGQHLACSLANTSTQIFKMPLTGKGHAFAGHKGIVTSSQWSHDNQWLITSSDDRSAAIWSLGLPDPVMTMNMATHNFGVDKEGGLKPDKENPLFTKPVRFAQFYYVDKFILLTCGNTFYLYKYHLDTTKSDIKRYLSSNRYKLVTCFQMTGTHQITAFSAVNSFHSYLAFCTGSNKALEVFDINASSSVRTIADVHTKVPHVICQNQGSAFVSRHSLAYDLFITAAAGDCIKLWDLRTNRCVARYEGHLNRYHPCGLAFSPCSRFIATGAEDRSAYVFDIRSGTYLNKLTGHTDTVSDVAFHPLHPQLLTATLDGKLRLFINKK